ncbi:Hypothetical protein POVR1_LOCUS403 [uncultured virus]|nr:Hypothetical protein POVR1_LOCUS403 [uncultured virus]
MFWSYKSTLRGHWDEKSLKFIPKYDQEVNFEVLKTRLKKGTDVSRGCLFAFYKEMVHAEKITEIPIGMTFGYFCGGGS